jgi:hypothetical protein
LLPLVLHVEDALAVLRPEVAAHGAGGVGRHRLGGVERLVYALHPDVHDAPVRLDERHLFPVGGELGPGALRIAEERLPVDEGRELALILDGGRFYVLGIHQDGVRHVLGRSERRHEDPDQYHEENPKGLRQRVHRLCVGWKGKS